jgi:protocatechuate 3,4-dioxygenase beta subunit
MLKKLFLLLFIFFLGILAQEATIYATIISPEYILNKRNKITPKLTDLTSKPINFSKSNNLRRRKGSYFLAKGEFLILKGTVTDLLDNPVQNVKINIWQADNFGYYKFLISEKDNYAHLFISHRVQYGMAYHKPQAK